MIPRRSARRTTGNTNEMTRPRANAPSSKYCDASVRSAGGGPTARESLCGRGPEAINDFDHGSIQEVRARAARAALSAKECGACGEALSTMDPVWRRPVRLGVSVLRRPVLWITPVCKRCRGSDDDYHLKPVPCVGCRRPVVNRSPRANRQYTTCSERCRLLARSRVRAQQRRRETPVCRQCGRAFSASRSDALYCANACRQRTYRSRTAYARVTCAAAPLQARVSVKGNVIRRETFPERRRPVRRLPPVKGASRNIGTAFLEDANETMPEP